MGTRYHVRKTEPSYGTGYFNNQILGFENLLNELNIEYYFQNEDDTQIEMRVADIEKVLLYLRNEGNDKTFIWDDMDEPYTADDIDDIFQTWLDEVEHTNEYITIEAF